MFKVNPPLRTADDVEALRLALADGTIDVVAADHAPHASQDKECEWDNASPGMLGLQTALSVVIATMVETGLLDWRGVARVLSESPARIGGLTGRGRPIAVGEPANLVLVDPAARWTVRGTTWPAVRQHPFEGIDLPGRVIATFLRGRATVVGGVLAAVKVSSGPALVDGGHGAAVRAGRRGSVVGLAAARRSAVRTAGTCCGTGASGC